MEVKMSQWKARCMMIMMLALLALVPQITRAKTVVVIPAPYTSHTKYHTNVARALTKLGHDVWVTMPTYLLNKGYQNTTGFNIIPYETVPNLEEETMVALTGNYFQGKMPDFFEFLRICRGITQSTLTNDTLLETIRKKDPDLIVLENIFMLYGFAIIPYRLGKPFAFLGSVYYPRYQRIPFSPADTPIQLFALNNKMTFVERVQNTLTYLLLMLYNPSLPDDLVATYAPEMPYIPMDMLVTKAEIFLVETDHILDYPRPTVPNVKLIGGTATGPAKPLSADFQKFMDEATEGVVVVSFGSYVLDLPEEISDKLFNVFVKLPMKVVMRSNLTSPHPSKIMTSSWLPQNDLLGHRNTKVFLNHCGKNGQYEALYHTVPMVCMPLFNDQFYNAERARDKGIGEVLDLRTCTSNELFATILQVSKHPKYKQTITQLSHLFKHLYGLPQKTAAYWLDHVMQYGGDYMRSGGQEMPYYQFLLLDVLSLLALVDCVILGLFCFCVFRCWKCCRRRKLKSE